MPGGLFSWRPRILGGRKTPEPTQAVQITIAPEPPELPETASSKSRNVRFDEPNTTSSLRQSESFLKDRPSSEWTNNFGGEARVIGTVRPEKNLTSWYTLRSFRNILNSSCSYSKNTFWHFFLSTDVPGPSGRNPPEKAATDWRYADDVKVCIAPLSSSDIDRPIRSETRNRLTKFSGFRSQMGSEIQRSSVTTSRANSVLQSLREQVLLHLMIFEVQCIHLEERALGAWWATSSGLNSPKLR